MMIEEGRPFKAERIALHSTKPFSSQIQGVVGGYFYAFLRECRKKFAVKNATDFDFFLSHSF